MRLGMQTLATTVTQQAKVKHFSFFLHGWFITGVHWVVSLRRIACTVGTFGHSLGHVVGHP